MTTESKTLLYGLSKATIDLSGLCVALDRKANVDLQWDVQVLVNLFSLDEIHRYEGMTSREASAELIAHEKIIEVVNHAGKINFDYSCAGLPLLILELIHKLSIAYANNIQDYYTKHIETKVTLVHQMAAVVSNRLNMPYPDVCSMTPKDITELYAVCAKSFPDVYDFNKEVELPNGND